VPLSRVFAGIFPFWFAMLAGLILIIAFPDIALLLPNTMIK
jgi:TRAP-type C4-dicarboxylate transport system permease large subunit